MAKKSKAEKEMLQSPEVERLASKLASLLDISITPDQLIEVMNDFLQKGPGGILNEFYSYQRPDYAAMVKPLHPALEPIVEMEGIRGLTQYTNQALQQLLDEDREAASQALINALYYILANQERLQTGDHTAIPLMAILHLMVELRVKNATPALLELLSQDGTFYEFFITHCEDIVSFAISQLCKDDLDALQDFAHLSDRVPLSQIILVDGVVHMALTDEAMRPAVIDWCATLLDKIAVNPDIILANVDHLTNTISQLNDESLKPAIRRIYSECRIPFTEFDSDAERAYIINNGTPDRRVEIESIGSTIAEIEEGYLAEQDYDDEDDDEYDNDSFLVWENDDNMLYRLEISLDNSPIEVKRELIVPSNVRLSWMSIIMRRVMGWDGGHLDQFVKNHDYYMDLSENDEWIEDDVLDSCAYALNDLLPRKGSKMQWEYDFGDGWRHTIRVAERIKDDGRCPIECISAVNACPPDDCGGTPGYAHLLEVLKDRKHPEYHDLKGWLPRGFNPTKVSIKAINKSLSDLLDLV